MQPLQRISLGMYISFIIFHICLPILTQCVCALFFFRLPTTHVWTILNHWLIGFILRLINQRLTIIHAWIRLMGICTFRIWIIQKCKWLRNIFIFDRWAPIPPWMESSIANLILSSFSRNLGISARILVKLLFLVLHFFTFWINSGYFFFGSLL